MNYGLTDVMNQIWSNVNSDWTYQKNRRCEFVNLRISMADIKCKLMDWTGKEIDLEQLKYQDDKIISSENERAEYETGDIIEMFGDVRHFLVTGFITDSERLFVVYECEDEIEIKFSDVSNRWRQYL